MTRALSNHQAGLYDECPLQWWAYAHRMWRPTQTEAMLAGSYGHCALLEPDALPTFAADNTDIFKANGEPRAKFKAVEAIVEAAGQRPEWMRWLEGEREVCLEWELDGVPWTGRIDVLNREEGFIADLKFTRSIKADARVSGRMLPWQESPWWHYPWYEAYRGHRQMALYQEAALQNGIKIQTLVMAAVTLESPPAFAVIRFQDEGKLLRALHDAEERGKEMAGLYDIPFDEVPGACGECEVCRTHLAALEIVA